MDASGLDAVDASGLPPRGRLVTALPLERVVADGEDGTRADILIAGWLGESRAQAQQRFARGLVLVDTAPVPKARRLQAGEVVLVSPAAPPEPVAAPPTVAVRWEDDDLAVIAKPAGMVVHAGAGVRDATLVDALRGAGMSLAAAIDTDRPGIVHRLDRGTSGLLVVAKSTAALDGLRRSFKAHDVERRYWALVDGSPRPPSATIDAPIARSARHRHRFVVDAGGRPAVSHYDVEEDLGRATVVTVGLETGRTHQVRVHLAAVGHPVCGDRVYGASAATAGLLGLDRPALHARHLAFAHPVTGTRVALDEPLPDDLTAALAALRGTTRSQPTA